MPRGSLLLSGGGGGSSRRAAYGWSDVRHPCRREAGRQARDQQDRWRDAATGMHSHGGGLESGTYLRSGHGKKSERKQREKEVRSGRRPHTSSERSPEVGDA